MSFNIEIIEERKNPLIDRNEINFTIEHFGAGTPNRLEIKKKIAALKGAKENLTIVRNVQTHFGGANAVGKVHIYEDGKELQYFEPFHVQVRNLPKEKRTEIYKLKKKKEPYKHLFA